MLRCLALDVDTLRDAVEYVQDAVVHNFVHMVRIAPTIFSKGVTNRLRALITRMHARMEEEPGALPLDPAKGGALRTPHFSAV